MQKQSKFFILIALMFLFSPELASAGIISLPRYTGEFAYRTNSGGRDQTCSASYKYTCSGTGYSGGSGTACGDKYQSCVCAANYKWSGGSCTLKTCADYGYSPSEDTTKSCEEKTPRSGLTCYACTSCNTTTYKYSCSGGLNATEQGTDNKCGTSYSECACVDNASWNSSTGKCECGSDYEASSNGTSCTLKTCDDYSLLAANDTSKNCTKSNPRSGLECWSCSDCTGTLYDCGSITNASGGEGTACGGKYPSCSCKSLYRWDNGSCVLNCTRNSCSTTAYPLTAQNAANASSYEKCTPSCSDESPRYKVASCASGYNVNSNASGCDQGHVHSYHCQSGYQETNEWGSNADIYPKVCDCGEIAGNTLCYKGRPHVHSFHCPVGSPYQEVNEWGSDAETFPMYCDCGERSSDKVCYKAPTCGSEFIYNCKQLGFIDPEDSSATCGSLSTYCGCEKGKHWSNSSKTCVTDEWEFEICTGITEYHQIGTITYAQDDLNINVYVDGKKVGTVYGPELYGLEAYGGGDYWHPADPQWVCQTFNVSGASTLMLEYVDYVRPECDGSCGMCYSHSTEFTWVNDNGYGYVQPNGSCQHVGIGATLQYTLDDFYMYDPWVDEDIIRIKIEIPYGNFDAVNCAYPSYSC